MVINKKLRCAECGTSYEADISADAVVCPHCQHRLARIDQVSELLDEWYYPRRWHRDVDRPRARLLVEKLWQQQFDPQEMYATLSPSNTNFEVFCYTVTNVILGGIAEGWVRLDIPPDPLADDPVYRLEILDKERFSAQMEQSFPDVKWDEDVEVVDPGAAEATA